MADKKGFELAISTIILLILGLLVVLGLILAFTGGLKKFQKNTGILLDSAEGSIVKKACELACAGEDKVTYCCKNQTIQGQVLLCSDKRLEVDCNLECEGFQC